MRTLRYLLYESNLFKGFFIEIRREIYLSIQFSQKIGTKFNKNRTLCLLKRRKIQMSENSNPKQNKYTYKYIQFTATPTKKSKLFYRN